MALPPIGGGATLGGGGLCRLCCQVCCNIVYKLLPPVGRLAWLAQYLACAVNSNAVNSTGLPRLGAASLADRPQCCEVFVYIQVFLFKMSFFGNDDPYRHKNQQKSWTWCHAAACQISPSYDAAFRSLETEKNKQTFKLALVYELSAMWPDLVHMLCVLCSGIKLLRLLQQFLPNIGPFWWTGSAHLMFSTEYSYLILTFVSK